MEKKKAMIIQLILSSDTMQGEKSKEQMWMREYMKKDRRKKKRGSTVQIEMTPALSCSSDVQKYVHAS